MAKKKKKKDKKVPARWGLGGPVVGTATVRETPEGIVADMVFDTSIPEGREAQDWWTAPPKSYSIGRKLDG